MGATFFMIVLIMAAMLLCAAGLLVISVVLLLIRSHRKRRGKPMKRRYTVVPAVFFVLAILCALPPVCVVSYIRTSTAQLDNHISYGATMIGNEDGTFSLGGTTYHLVQKCELTDAAELGEPVANCLDDYGYLRLGNIFLRVLGVYGDPVYPVENEFGFDLLSVGNILLCSDRDFEELTALCSSYEEWGSFHLIRWRHDVSGTEVSLSPEVFAQMVQWRDGEHTPDRNIVDETFSVTLVAVSPDKVLSCPLVDILCTENGEWSIQCIIWNESTQGQFSTEPLPEQWAAELLPALEQIAGNL